MFVRKRKNLSGSTSIQIIDKTSGRYSVIEHIGTSKEPNEIKYLYNLGKDRIIEIERQLSLLPSTKHKHLKSWLTRFKHFRTLWVGFEEVFGTVFDRLKYCQVNDNPLLKTLVIARIAHPYSKQSIQRWIRRKYDIDLSKNTTYRFMSTLDDEKERKVCKHTFNFVRKQIKEKIHVIFFDATTLHFETFKNDGFRQTGYSKVGKHNQPQIVIGLMVTKDGLPVGYEVYPGNEFDGFTIRSALKKVTRRYKVDQVVFVADSAMLSTENTTLIEEAGYQFIMAAKIKNMSHKIEAEIHSHDYFSKFIFSSKYAPDRRLIVTYSEERASKDRTEREKQIERIKKKLTRKTRITKSKVGKIGKSKYLHVVGDAEVWLNHEAIRTDAKWDGLKGYITNIPEKDLSDNEVVKKYTELWQVEKAFRISKSDLNIRPVYHYKRERIRAHVLLVFMSLVVSRYTEYLLRKHDISTAKLVEHLDGVQAIQIQDTKAKVLFEIRTELTKILYKIYMTLNIDVPIPLKVVGIG